MERKAMKHFLEFFKKCEFRLIKKIQTQVIQTGMVIGASTQRPMILSVRLFDREIIDARNTPFPQHGLVELPVLVPVTVEPAP
jgi:hypothetical protein